MGGIVNNQWGWVEMIAQISNTSIVLENEDELDEVGITANISKISELEYLADIVSQLHKISAGFSETTLSHLFEMLLIEIRLQLDVEKYKANTLNL